MKNVALHQYCLLKAESFWAIQRTRPDQLERNKVAILNEISSAQSLNYYLFIQKISKYGKTFHNIQQREQYKRNRRKNPNHYAAVKIASATPLNLLKLLLQKCSVTVLPIFLSVGMIFSPLNMASTDQPVAMGHIEHADEPFQISEGYIEYTDFVWDELAEDSESITEHPPKKFSAPYGLRIINEKSE